eukprot:SAG22_NODE_788_length_7234_cov_18.112123_5_plen_126_part_00
MMVTVIKMLESLESGADAADALSTSNIMSALCERADRTRHIVDRYRFVHDEDETAASDEKKRAVLDGYERTLAAKRELVAKIQKMSVLQQPAGGGAGDGGPAAAVAAAAMPADKGAAAAAAVPSS